MVANDLHPAEGFFDPLTDLLAYGISRMTSGPLIDGGCSAGVVLSYMGCDVKISQVLDKIAGVVAFICTYGYATRTSSLLYHGQRSFSLSGTRCVSQLNIYNEAVAVLHEHMAGIAKLGFFPFPFFEQPGIGTVVDAWVSFVSL